MLGPFTKTSEYSSFLYLSQELKPKVEDYRYKFMQNMLMISTKQKSGVEAALQASMDASQKDVSFLFSSFRAVELKSS